MQNVTELCGEPHLENNYKGLSAAMEDNLRLATLKLQSKCQTNIGKFHHENNELLLIN